MRIFTLLARNLKWYWRTNLAVLLGVATAAGVLGGALLVGDSVRASLRDLVLARLGNTDYVVARNGFFREELASAFTDRPGRPVLRSPSTGMVVHPASGRRAFSVQIYGVEKCFWQRCPAAATQILLTSALASELAAHARRRSATARREAFRDSTRIAAWAQG